MVVPMNGFFDRLALRGKLILVIMLACGLLLSLGSAVVLLAEIHSSRVVLEDELRVLGTSLAANGRRSLVLGRRERLDELLRSLETQRNVQAAYFFDGQGTPLAEYHNPRRTELVIKALQQDFQNGRLNWQEPGQHFSGGGFSHLGMLTPIYFDERRVGALYLLSDLDDLYGRIYGILAGSGCALILLLACSWPLANRLQRPLSRPILDLATLSEEISRSRNYAIRATPGSTDEIGTLVNSFNRMLDEIQDHQQQLAAHHRQLEQRVAERTEELRLTVHRLEEATLSAEQANAAKSAFLSRMTHELRTPLIGVLGMNELLERSELTGQQATLVATIQKSGEELLRLINDVLDLSRVEAGKLELDPQPLDLYRTVEEVTLLLAPQARRKGLLLSLDIPRTATVKVLADDTRIRQVLTNLLANAIRYTESGQVSVRLSTIESSADTTSLCLQVADTGCGMDEQTRARIFDVFYQGEVVGSRERGGAGLGLAIVRQLVDLMGGELDLQTLPGEGSCFTLTLPVPVLEAPPAFATNLSGVPALICLNDAHAAALLSRRLHEMDLSVAIADSAEDALYRLRTEQRLRRPAPLLLTDAASRFVDGSRLADLIGPDAGETAPRGILVECAAESEPMSQPGCVPLEFPLTWNGLQQALERAWQSLRLVPTIMHRPDCAEQLGAASRGRVLVLGASPAGRELIRLSLEGQNLQATAAEADAVRRESWTFTELHAVFVDGADLAPEALESLLIHLRRHLHCPCYLVGRLRAEHPVSLKFDGCLSKPLDPVVIDHLLPRATPITKTHGDSP